MKREIRILYKRPEDEVFREEMVRNELKPLQELVDGYIETIPFRDGDVLLFNEMGLLRDMEPNIYYEGGLLVGPVVVIGTAGEDFADVSISADEMNVALGLFDGMRKMMDKAMMEGDDER